MMRLNTPIRIAFLSSLVIVFLSIFTFYMLDYIDSKIIAVIDQKDARIASFLEDVKLKLDNDCLVIELGNSDNDFTKKTLDNNLDLIISSIEQISNQKFKVQIESNTNKANVDDEESHPLLESLKEKFKPMSKSKCKSIFK